MSFQDKTLTCVDCNQPFVFTISEQEFHASKGFTNEPKRCNTCRQNRRAERDGGSYSSGSYQRREMFSAVCAQCNKPTQVPFQPRGDRPVYCSDCYSKQGGARSRR
jgi:CxxC-x17-CxxC domain-containing protein